MNNWFPDPVVTLIPPPPEIIKLEATSTDVKKPEPDTEAVANACWDVTLIVTSSPSLIIVSPPGN